MFGSIVAIDDISFSLAEGQFGTLLGPSGSGKSTVLRIVAGLEQLDSGSIFIGDRDVGHLPPYQRPSAMVFQRYALFPHMTVRQNIAFGLQQQKLPATTQLGRIADALDLVAMSDRADAYPHQLSGGQEQRIALARALVVRPGILLLDEPLAALDASLRARMQSDLRSIQRQTGITFLSVTHDQEEALSMSDWMAVLNHGLVSQQGTPRDMFERPANRFVAEFLGSGNIVPVQIGDRTGQSTTVHLAGRDIRVPGSTTLDDVLLMIRPGAISLIEQDHPGWNARLLSATYLGSMHRLVIALDDGTRLTADIATRPVGDLVIGEHYRIAIESERLALVPRD
ncbi:MAG: ABC transporter ATP-binding protein [Thermomicrobiales bacterium]